MATTDEVVLAYIGPDGRSRDAVRERFPSFDMTRLIRAQLVEVTSGEPGETEAHTFEPTAPETRYVLTSRGADAVGIAARLPDA
jgi:hypothetical protein